MSRHLTVCRLTLSTCMVKRRRRRCPNFFFCSDKQWKILPSENEAEAIFDFVIFLHGKSLSNGAHADEYL